MRKIEIRNFLQFIIKRKIILQTLLVVVMVSFMPGMVRGQLAINCTNTTCYIDGGNDGSILVTITTTTTGGYRYSILDGTNTNIYPSTDYTSETDHTFPDLQAGTYIITVIDDAATPGSATCTPITIVQPTATLSWLENGQNWTCEGITPCTGQIPKLTGGASPYTYVVNTVPVTSPITDYDALCAGTYSIVGIDTNGCSLSRAENFVVNSDNEAPTNCKYPKNYSITSSAFQTMLTNTPPTPVTITPKPLDGVSLGYDYTNVADPGTDINGNVRFGINAANYTNLQFQVTATPVSSGPAWTINDHLQIEICYDTTAPTWEALPILNDDCEWNTSDCDGTYTPGNELTAWIDLPVNNQRKFWIRINCSTDDIGKGYNDISVSFQGVDIKSFLTPARTSEPSGCTDLDQSLNYNPLDDAYIIWRCYDPMEFSFKRRWTPTDDCGHAVTTPVYQTISIGDPPVVNGGAPLADLTFDYCHNSLVDITGPAVTDGCGIPAPVLRWRIFDTQATPNSIGAGTGDIVDFIFPNNSTTLGETFKIWWKAIDGAGNVSDSISQNVIFTPEIVVSILPITEDIDFCSGEEATFEIRAIGGTGVFDVQESAVTPAATTWSGWSTGTNSVTYTTNLLTSGAPNIRVTILDSDNLPILGGCPPAVGNPVVFPSATPEYTVHPNITTGTITRTP